MKIVVDEMPKRPEECCFHEFDFYERMYTCGVPGNYGYSCVPNCCKCLIAIREMPDDIDGLNAKCDEMLKEGAK